MLGILKVIIILNTAEGARSIQRLELLSVEISERVLMLTISVIAATQGFGGLRQK
jgi:hypothetical protein